MKKILILIILLFLLALFGFSEDYNNKKFRLEVISGFSFLEPEDLNANATIREQITKYWYEDRYDYFVKVGYIQSYDTKQDGRFRSIKSTLPLGPGIWLNWGRCI